MNDWDAEQRKITRRFNAFEKRTKIWATIDHFSKWRAYVRRKEASSPKCCSVFIELPCDECVRAIPYDFKTWFMNWGHKATDCGNGYDDHMEWLNAPIESLWDDYRRRPTIDTDRLED